MDKIKFIITPLLALFVSIYLFYVGYVYFNQAEMVFMNAPLSKDYMFDFEKKFEEKSISSFDGKKQHGLLFKVNEPKGIIFYLHGNAGNLATWGTISEFYTSLGYDFFILDYRGFGKSEGQIENEEQVLKDVQIVFDKITKSYSQKVLIGYSIGTGIASHLASVRKCTSLILQAPYVNLMKLTESKVPYFPNYLKKFQFETDKKWHKITCPIYLFHGDEDHLIGLENSIQLKQYFNPKDHLFVLKQQGHIGINENTDFQKEIKLLLNN